MLKMSERAEKIETAKKFLFSALSVLQEMKPGDVFVAEDVADDVAKAGECIEDLCDDDIARGTS